MLSLCYSGYFLNKNNIDVIIDGGWGVDALLGEQTRTHDDLDVAVQHEDRSSQSEDRAASGRERAPRARLRHADRGARGLIPCSPSRGSGSGRGRGTVPVRSS